MKEKLNNSRKFSEKKSIDNMDYVKKADLNFLNSETDLFILKNSSSSGNAIRNKYEIANEMPETDQFLSLIMLRRFLLRQGTGKNS